DIDTQDSRGDSALHYAAREGIVEMAKFLIGYQADSGMRVANINLQNEFGETALHLAIRSGENVSVLESLIQHGGDINAKDKRGMRPIHHRTAKRLGSSAAMVRRLLLLVPEQTKRLRLLSTQDRFGQTALHSAANRGTLGIFRVLFEAGADLELCDRNGIKP
ncbi:ankyrin, partial [Colletotrichum somersetense]